MQSSTVVMLYIMSGKFAYFIYEDFAEDFFKIFYFRNVGWTVSHSTIFSQMKYFISKYLCNAGNSPHYSRRNRNTDWDQIESRNFSNI